MYTGGCSARRGSHCRPVEGGCGWFVLGSFPVASASSPRSLPPCLIAAAPPPQWE